MTPATAPSKGQQSSQLCRGQFKRDSWRGPFTDLSTLSMDQWVLEIRLLHTLVAPTRSRPGISHLISPQHRAYPAQVEGGCPRAALLCPPTPPRSPATHVVIPEQNLLPQVVPLQSPRELQSSELTSQKLGVDKGLGVGRPCSDQAPPGGLWPPPARGTYQLLDPLPLCLWGELRTQGLDLIPPYQDGPTKGQEEREVCGAASTLTQGLPPAASSSSPQEPVLPMPVPCPKPSTTAYGWQDNNAGPGTCCPPPALHMAGAQLSQSVLHCRPSTPAPFHCPHCPSPSRAHSPAIPGVGHIQLSLQGHSHQGCAATHLA